MDSDSTSLGASGRPEEQKKNPTESANSEKKNSTSLTPRACFSREFHPTGMYIIFRDWVQVVFPME